MAKAENEPVEENEREADEQYSIADWDDTEEEVVLPDDTYDLRIVSVESGMTKDGSKRKMVFQITALDHPNAETIFEQITFPNRDDKSKNANFSRRLNKRFFTLIGIDPTGFSKADMIGKEFRCAVGHDEYNNRVKNVLVPPSFK